MSHLALPRRRFLRGVARGGLVLLALPFLESLSPRRGLARAGSSGFPVRFGLYFWGNGNLPELWTPAQEGEGYTLSEQLSPLAGLEDRFTVLTGFSCHVENNSPHGSGAGAILTGQALITDQGESTMAGPSLDQLVAQSIGGDTLYRSLQTAATSCSGNSWNGPHSRNPPDTDPYVLYERLFGDTFRAPGEEGIVDPMLGLRRSALDAVMGDLQTLQGQLGSADRARLEQHLDGVRDLEKRLARLEEDPPALEACARPAALTADYSDVDGRPQISARSRVVAELLAMALACDQTRVFAHFLTDPVSDVLFPEASAGHHDLTHNESGDQPEVNAITRQCVAEYAALIQALDAIPEGDGTLLDHCVLLGTSEVSLGRTHSIDEMPLLIAGGGDGALRMGLHLRSWSQDNVNKPLLSALRAVDPTLASLGADDTFTTEGLDALEV